MKGTIKSTFESFSSQTYLNEYNHLSQKMPLKSDMADSSYSSDNFVPNEKRSLISIKDDKISLSLPVKINHFLMKLSITDQTYTFDENFFNDNQLLNVTRIFLTQQYTDRFDDFDYTDLKLSKFPSSEDEVLQRVFSGIAYFQTISPPSQTELQKTTKYSFVVNEQKFTNMLHDTNDPTLEMVEKWKLIFWKKKNINHWSQTLPHHQNLTQNQLP